MKSSNFLSICGVLVTLLSCSGANAVDNSTVKDFDLQKYLGTWYEQARYDHSFERGLTHCTAQYSLRPDGKVSVLNRGLKNGKPRESEGKAKLTKTPGLLRVSFWGPFYSDYRVLMLGPNYSYALVGSSSDKYLWILSRTPLLPEDTILKILNEATRRGYDVSKLIWVNQQKAKYTAS